MGKSSKGKKKDRTGICIDCGEYTRIPKGDLGDKDELCGNCLSNQGI